MPPPPKMVMESIISGARNALLTEIPGTTLNIAEVAGAGLVVGLLIWGGRKLIHGILGAK